MWEYLELELKKLRSLLETSPSARGRLEFFDEFLEHNEFGTCTGRICAITLEEQSVPLERAEFEAITSLHAQMGLKDADLKDTCIETLRRM